jgi:hypothetical protein
MILLRFQNAIFTQQMLTKTENVYVFMRTGDTKYYGCFTYSQADEKQLFFGRTFSDADSGAICWSV